MISLAIRSALPWWFSLSIGLS